MRNQQQKPTDLECKMMVALIVAIILLQVMMVNLDHARAALDICRGLK